MNLDHELSDYAPVLWAKATEDLMLGSFRVHLEQVNLPHPVLL
jgi:hypothetical protein